MFLVAGLSLMIAFSRPAHSQAILSPDKLLIRCAGGQCTPVSTTLTNVGSTTVTILSISISGSASLAQTNNCGVTLKPGQSCTISLTASPSAGTSTDALNIDDSAPNSPQRASIKVLAKK
jgi:hypothetical protein